VRITDKKLKSAILYALADGEMVRILDCTKNEAKSAVEIMKLNDISHSTAYRKIKWLLDNGLLIVDKIVITDDGKKFSLLKSTLKTIQINYDDDVVIEVKENTNKFQALANKFFSIGEC